MKKNLLISLLAFLGMFAFLSSGFAQSNQYLHFDRVDDYCSLPNASQYIANSNEITMMGWFYTDQLAYGQGMMSFRSSSGAFYLIQLNNGKLECRFMNSSSTLYEYVAPEYTVIAGQWMHYAWIYDGSSVSLYIDGVLHGSSPASGMISNANIEFTIGKCLLSGFNFVYGGRADEVSVWSKALSQSEIQDYMVNELTGNETDLQLYYKFNQGDPGGNNTSITTLESETGTGDRDMDLLNFAMTGNTSNFDGTLNVGFQTIAIEPIPDKMISDPAFYVSAEATSGLEVELSIVSGPATIVDSTITLTGLSGEVVLEANQAGDGFWQPAAPVQEVFWVLDPTEVVPNVKVLSPLEGDVYDPDLDEVLLSCQVDIDFQGLFEVEDVYFVVDNETIPATSFNNTYYTAWWKPSDYGQFTVYTNASNNFGSVNSIPTEVTVTPSMNSIEVLCFEDVWVSVDNGEEVVEGDLPTFTGAFDQITATLNVHCPTGGCGEWDRYAKVEAKTKDGRWIEIIRYITPYGVACAHTTDVTDYMSIFQGKTEFRVTCGTLDNGYEYDLTLNYHGGTPDHKFSSVNAFWMDTYPFGDYENLQPIEERHWTFPANAVDAKLKIMNTGHGWGDLNTDNAAEFYEAHHTIRINSDDFDQHLWATCNPNPDGCQPQNGTWYYNRAGWCPGSIAMVFDYPLLDYVDLGAPVTFNYELFPGYVDLCHPHHPDCVDGVTCSNCNDSYNPHLIVASNIITYYDTAYTFELINVLTPQYQVSVNAYPNPNIGEFVLESQGFHSQALVQIYDLQGRLIDSFKWNGESKWMDMREHRGVFLILINVDDQQFKKRIIIE